MKLALDRATTCEELAAIVVALDAVLRSGIPDEPRQAPSRWRLEGRRFDAFDEPVRGRWQAWQPR
jgi:hypothetical protein